MMKNKQVSKPRNANKRSATYVAFKSKRFATIGQRYVIFSGIVLLLSSAWWSFLGAVTHSQNADQIISSYLFQDSQTFSQAIFPGAHTFLLKWPLFIVERLFEHSEVVLVILTMLVSLVTVGGLAYILYRIDRRPKVFGTALLALACILIMIPNQPFAGSLLPTNFAMLTTRNIEYLIYILSLVLIIRSDVLKSWRFVAGMGLLTSLISSDKLFMWFSLGGALITAAVYAVARRPSVVHIALRWLLATLIALVAAFFVVWIVDLVGPNIIGDSGPYGFVDGIKQLVSGTIFAVLGLLTNFGVNPVVDTVVIKDLPMAVLGRLASVSTIPFAINLGLFIAGIVAVVRFVKSTFVDAKRIYSRKQVAELPIATILSIALIASTIAAIGLFVLTDHYYPVDSRYITISLFAISIATITYIRSRPLPVIRREKVIPGLLVAGVIIGFVASFNVFQQQSSATSAIDERNVKVAEALESHRSNVLVGDYWRVLPINQLWENKNSTIIPLDNCTTPRVTLISGDWRKDFEQKPFSYLLTLETGSTGYEACSIDTIIQKYGHPNASTLITGTNDKPTELVLFYDQGVTNNRARTNPPRTTTILPNTTQQIKPISMCTDDVTVMNIVAHQDDDLLFMNPDVQRHIDSGHCVRTVYVTSGDAGQNSQYWLGREKASEAAYEYMLGLDKQKTVWTQRTVKLADQEYVTIVNPRGNRQVSLIFMRLPDGNLTGHGFGNSGFESLAELLSGKISKVNAVDQQSSYSSDSIVSALMSLMALYTPTQINTQAATNLGNKYDDHSDHKSVGQYVDKAYAAYSGKDTVNLTHYFGYGIREHAENIFGMDLDRKTNAFLSYATFDGGVCQSKALCDKTPTYSAYLHRQYPQ